jgi:hypothetical protein
MIPDYFTSYTHQLEWVEALVDEKLAALTTFDGAVRNDWELTRKKRALIRLDEVKSWIENCFKTLQKDAEKSKLTKLYVPNLERLLTDIWTGKDSGDESPQVKELMNAIMLQPENVSGLLAAFQRIHTEIETTTLPSEKTATIYVNEKITQAMREAAQRVVTFRPYQSTETRIFR